MPVIQSYFIFARNFAWVLIVVLNTGCAELGTKTIFRSNELHFSQLKMIGYSQPANEIILDTIVNHSSGIHQAAMESFFADKRIEIKKFHLYNYISVDSVDKDVITGICKKNNLDGFIFTQIRFRFTNKYYFFIPFGTREDAYVEIQLFDKNGFLLLHTYHNTFAGNRYLIVPKAERTLRDGTIGALKQMIRESKIRSFNDFYLPKAN